MRMVVFGSVHLTPLHKLFQAEFLQRISEGSSGTLVAAGEFVVIPNHIGQPFGDGEAFVFAVGNWLQKPGADVRPIETGDPAALGGEESLENHAAVAGGQRFIHRKIPAGDRVERIDDAVEAVFLVALLSEPAAAEDTGELPVLFREYV